MTKKLTIFDLDRTLAPFGSMDLYPQAVDLLRQAAAEGYIGIATNQGGPALHDAGQKRPDGGQYPTSDEVLDRIFTLVTKIEALTGQSVIRTAICWLYKAADGQMYLPNHVLVRDFKAWEAQRKPNPGMVFDIMNYYRVKAADTTLIGDSDDDEKTARAAKVKFIHVNFDGVEK